MSALDGGPRSVIASLATQVDPLDGQEHADRIDVIRWVASGAPLFRVQPPATPPRHLAVYFVLLDERRREVMLVDHVKSGCWLPPGGHVDDGEDPRATVTREAREELGIDARFHHQLGGDRPFFLTVTQTRGAHSHTDVTLWFMLAADRDAPLHPDPREFCGVGWFGLDEPIDWSAATFDPQMHRFVAKLTSRLSDTPISSSASAP